MVQVWAHCPPALESVAERFRYLWATVPPGLLIIRRGKLSIEMRAVLHNANRQAWLIAILLVTALALAGCAALQPLSSTGPRGTEALYPVLLTEDTQRKESIAVALNRLGVRPGNPESNQPQLQPVTGTILNFSPSANAGLYLPKIGANAVMNEEETRESLRRFIREWQELIGSEPSKLSLVERTDQPDGTKLASYEQRPFRYPIRGNYGKLQIRFTNDRRVLNLTSSCIPEAERIQTSLSGLTGRLRSRELVQKLVQSGLVYTDATGNQVSLKIASANITPRGLVTYILPSRTRPDALEFHLAYEMDLSGTSAKLAYVDAITGEPIVVE